MSTAETPLLRCHLASNAVEDLGELAYLRVRVDTLSKALTELAQQRDTLAERLDVANMHNDTLRAQVKALANLAASSTVPA